MEAHSVALHHLQSDLQRVQNISGGIGDRCRPVLVDGDENGVADTDARRITERC